MTNLNTVNLGVVIDRYLRYCYHHVNM